MSAARSVRMGCETVLPRASHEASTSPRPAMPAAGHRRSAGRADAGGYPVDRQLDEPEQPRSRSGWSGGSARRRASSLACSSESGSTYGERRAIERWIVGRSSSRCERPVSRRRPATDRSYSASIRARIHVLAPLAARAPKRRSPRPRGRPGRARARRCPGPPRGTARGAVLTGRAPSRPASPWTCATRLEGRAEPVPAGQLEPRLRPGECPRDPLASPRSPPRSGGGRGSPTPPPRFPRCRPPAATRAGGRRARRSASPRRTRRGTPGRPR